MRKMNFEILLTIIISESLSKEATFDFWYKPIKIESFLHLPNLSRLSNEHMYIRKSAKTFSIRLYASSPWSLKIYVFELF